MHPAFLQVRISDFFYRKRGMEDCGRLAPPRLSVDKPGARYRTRPSPALAAGAVLILQAGENRRASKIKSGLETTSLDGHRGS